jgi:phage-related protein
MQLIMPQTEVVFFKDEDGAVSVLDWIENHRRINPRLPAKAVAFIDRLSDFGYDLRRPAADLLREGIYELRFALQGVNYRILYFYAGKNVAVLVHGLTKEGEVPSKDIETAKKRRDLYLSNPERFTYEEDDDGY